MDSKYIVVKTTFKTVEDAALMASRLVQKHIVASCHTSEIFSTYYWKGTYNAVTEIELSCITRKALFGIVKGFIEQNHPYTCAQVIAIPIISISEDFELWIDEQTTQVHE